MANRAYLYSCDMDDPYSDNFDPQQIELDFNNTRYYDSRHGIPWAWLFLFHPAAPKSKWESGFPLLRFITSKEDALFRFARHMPHICQIAGTRFMTDETLGKFVADLKERPGNALIADFREVVDDGGEEDAAYFRHVLELIDAGESVKSLQNAIKRYSWFEYENQDKFDLWVTGVTYW